MINGVINAATVSISTLDITQPTATGFMLSAQGGLTLPGAGTVSADIQPITLSIYYKSASER